VSRIFLRACLGALLACAALTSACSVIVAPEDTVILCQYDPAFPPDPCPTGFECVAGRCLATIAPPPPPDGCVPTDELCSGEDENCNGIIDEGFDADGDGYTFCGTQRGADGNFVAGPLLPVFVDCADDDPFTHPGAAERCDGVDNDCASATPADVSSEVCPTGFECNGRARTCVDPLDCTIYPCSGVNVCDSETRRCIAGSCPTCASDERCDIGTMTCVPRRDDGERCNLDNECMSGACFDLAQLGATSSSSTRGVCSRACCIDNDCPGAADACFSAQSGARACLPTSRPGMPDLALRANATCASLFDECSFSYQPTGWCEDTDASICYFGGAVTCIWGFGTSACDPPCETGTACGGADTRCAFVLSGDTVTGVCEASSLRTFAAAGSACSSGLDCRDGVCIAGTCAATCCTDTDCCTATDCTHPRCLPAPGTFALMRCQTVPGSPG
jgi:hypothetical protein